MPAMLTDEQLEKVFDDKFALDVANGRNHESARPAFEVQKAKSIAMYKAAMASPVAAEKLQAEVDAEWVYHDFKTYLKYGLTDQGKFPNWPYIQNLADVFSSPYDITLLKRRQILLSWFASLYVDWVCSLHRGWNVGITSFTEEEVKEFVRKVNVAQKEVPDWMRRKGKHQVLTGVYTGTGSYYTGFASTANAGVSRTLADFIMDEAAKHEYAGDNLKAVSPSLYKAPPGDQRRRGRLIILSTSDPKLGRGGFMYEQWLKACRTTKLEETGDIAYWPEREPFKNWLARQDGRVRVVPVFISRWCRPDQPKEGPGSEWVEDEIDRMSEEEEQYGGSAAFDAYYPETPEMAFAGREGLVYGKDESGALIFDRQRNVQSAPIEWRDCDWRIVGIDPGGRDPAGIVRLGVWRNPGPPAPGQQNNHFRRQRHIYEAISHRGVMSIDEMETLFKKWSVGAPLSGIYIGETGGSTIVDTLRARGWPAYQATMDRSQIQHVQSMFRLGLLTVEPGDAGHVIMDEIGRYRWKKNGGAWATEVTGAGHADVLDALRYAVVTVLTHLPASYGDGLQAAATKPTASQIGRAPGLTRLGRAPGVSQLGGRRR